MSRPRLDWSRVSARVLCITSGKHCLIVTVERLHCRGVCIAHLRTSISVSMQVCAMGGRVCAMERLATGPAQQAARALEVLAAGAGHELRGTR